jgi:predicted PP-loop superfamily ATPase
MPAKDIRFQLQIILRSLERVLKFAKNQSQISNKQLWLMRMDDPQHLKNLVTSMFWR